MRHAEKPGDPKNPYLTEAGRRRAERLAQFIPAMFGKPDFVFAAAVNKNSFRAYLTMRPLCDAIAVGLDTLFEGDAYRACEQVILGSLLCAQGCRRVLDP